MWQHGSLPASWKLFHDRLQVSQDRGGLGRHGYVAVGEVACRVLAVYLVVAPARSVAE